MRKYKNDILNRKYDLFVFLPVSKLRMYEWFQSYTCVMIDDVI